MDKRFIVALLVVIGVFVGYLYTTKQDNNESGTQSANVTNHTTGAGNKKVTLVEYGDFQCPVCGQYFPVLQQVKAKYGDDITFQFRHYPIDSIHPNARAAHRAAEAAGNQGKFFDMHDLLYKNITSWSNSNDAAAIFKTYASQLSIDLAKFDSDVSSSTTNEIINADVAEGKRLGVSGTPTFFLNGRLLEDNERRSLEDFVKAIDAEIAKQGQ